MIVRNRNLYNRMKDNNQQNKDPREKGQKMTEDQLSLNEPQEEDKMAETMLSDEDMDPGENLTKELEELQHKYDELNDSYLRLHAEFDNFRKRTLKEKAELIKSGGERVLSDIISLVDDFDRALDSLHKTEDREAMLEGMDLIHSKFVLFLKQHGVTEIEAIGQPFDPDTFEAVTTVPVNEEAQKGVVVDCIQKGYRLNDKIIRFPKVIVGE